MKKKYIITLCLLAVALLSLLTVANIRPAPAHAQGPNLPSFVATDEPADQNTSEQATSTCDGTDQPCTSADSTDQQIASTQGVTNASPAGDSQSVTDNPPAGDPQSAAADKSGRKPQPYTHTHECHEGGVSRVDAHNNCKASLDQQITKFRTWYELDHCSPYTFTILASESSDGYAYYSAEGQTTCLYWFHG